MPIEAIVFAVIGLAVGFGISFVMRRRREANRPKTAASLPPAASRQEQRKRDRERSKRAGR